MSNQNVNNENRINKNKAIQNTETSINEKVNMNSLLQRIANGQTGVVLEELLWEIMVERKFGLSWKSANQTLINFYQLEYTVYKGLPDSNLFSFYATAKFFN